MFHPSKILLILKNDSPHREFVEKALSNNNYEIKKIEDTSLAKSIINKNNIKLIIAEAESLNSEGSNILSIVRDYEDSSQYLPPDVVIVSNDICTENVLYAMNHGATYYFTPPFDENSFKTKIDDILYRRKKKQEKFIKFYENYKKKKVPESKTENGVSALYHLSKSLSSTIETNRVIEMLVNGITDMIDCEASSLLLVDEDGIGNLHIQTFMDFSSECIGKFKNRIVSTWKTLSNREVEIKNEDIVSSNTKGEEGIIITEIKSWLSAPLSIGNNVIGLLSITNSKPKAFNQSNLEILYIISNLASRIIENARDGLTGLYNHRTFQDKLEYEFARSLRYHCPISLIMFDIDYFKSINDTYGHQKGDMVLKQIASGVKNIVRKLDSVCRYGGEEFAVILPETDIRYAGAVAEKIRKFVGEMDFSYLEPGKKLSVSLGVATHPGEPIAQDRFELIEQADTALYQAKRSGRNRVVIYSNQSLNNAEIRKPFYFNNAVENGRMNA